jgi:tetratricopeptide (TPR) repeat protein
MRNFALLAIIVTAGAWAFAQEAPLSARPALTFMPFADESPGSGAEVPPVPGMPFDVEAPMPWLGDGIPALLELALERSAAVNLFPRADLALGLKKNRDMELAPDSPIGDVSDVAKREGVTHVVAGSFYKEGNDLSFKVRVWPVGEEVRRVPQLEVLEESKAEMKRLGREMWDLGEELRTLMTDPSIAWEEKKGRAAEIRDEMDERNARMAVIAAEIKKSVPPTDYAVEVNRVRLEELDKLADELAEMLTDPAVKMDEKQRRAEVLRAKIREASAGIAEVVVVIPKGRSREFSGEADDLFALVDDAAKFVLEAADGETASYVARQPTSDMEAFKWFAKGASRYYTGEQISFFLRAADKDPTFAEAHLRLGAAYLKEKAYADAAAQLEESRGLADYYPSAAVALAAVSRKEEPENAEAAAYFYREALAVDPRYAPAFDGLGGMYFAAGDYEKARENYDNFIAVWPTNKDGYYALGNTLWLMGKDSADWKSLLRAAVESYEKSLSIDPDFAACHYNLASVYKIFEDVEKASYHYVQYIKLEPKNPKSKDIVETVEGWLPKFAPGSAIREEVEAAVYAWKAEYGQE